MSAACLCRRAARLSRHPVAVGEIEAVVVDQLRCLFRSPDMIARTFRETQAKPGRERIELAGQRARLQTRLAEMKKAIGRLARAGGNDGA